MPLHSPHYAHAPTVLLHTAEAARLLKTSVVTLERWRALRAGPPFVRLGVRSIRYRMADLQAWIDANRVVAG